MTTAPDARHATTEADVPEPRPAQEEAELAALTRSVSVPVRRLDAWVAGFQRRHGQTEVRRLDPEHSSHVDVRWLVTTADGTRALLAVPSWLGGSVGADLWAAERASDPVGPTVAPTRPSALPTFGVLMVRRAGYAVAVFQDGRKVQAKVGKRHIHGRTAAGGWSQQRYARRRANQTDEVVTATAAAFEAIAAPWANEFAVLVTGGDRPILGSTRELLADSPTGSPLTAVLADLPELHLGIGTPTPQVLADLPDRVLAVRIHLSENPDPKGDPHG